MPEWNFTAEELARALGGAERRGDEWYALAPCHDDNRPSLAIIDKNGRVVCTCLGAFRFYPETDSPTDSAGAVVTHCEKGRGRSASSLPNRSDSTVCRGMVPEARTHEAGCRHACPNAAEAPPTLI